MLARRRMDVTDDQVLLSTDTEVVGSYLEVIRSRLAATYHIRHEHDGDIGRSYVERGYFPGTRA